MNIIQAVKSGKKIKRSGWNEWYSVTTATRFFRNKNGEEILEDILADDWEVHEPTIVVTKSKVMAAWRDAHGIGDLPERLCKKFCEAIGFEEEK